MEDLKVHYDYNALRQRIENEVEVNQPIRIACVGPSGSGKTTMAKFLGENLNIPFIPNSAGIILPEETQEKFKRDFGWEKNGHAKVIELSMTNPEFARQYQVAILSERMQLIASHNRFIMDRSLIDNVTYCILQASLNSTQEWVEEFKDTAVEFFAQHMTHIIFFHPMSRDVENNGSRIANIHYQRAVNAVFTDTHRRYFQEPCQHIKKINMHTWDLEVKRSNIYEWLNAWVDEVAY